MAIAGLPVKDATKKITLHITPTDIKKGDSKNAAMCAAAQACKRQLHVEDARVHIGYIYIKEKDGKSWTRYRTPQSLRSEIIAFDRGGKFMSGDYTISPTSPANRLDERKKKRSCWQGSGPKGKPKKTVKRHKTLGIRHYGANR